MHALPLLAAGCVLAVVAAGGCATWQAARLYESGTRALDRGERAAAIAELERAAELAPQASEIRNHLGLAYAAAGRARAAERAFEAALDLDCKNDAARRNLSVLRGAALDI